MIGVNVHQIITLVDPLTGHARLLVATDNGVYSMVDDDGKYDPGIGTDQLGGPNKNGNLQLAQINYGAVQASTASASSAGNLFLAGTYNNGADGSDPDILSNGDLGWTSIGGVGVAPGIQIDAGGRRRRLAVADGRPGRRRLELRVLLAVLRRRPRPVLPGRPGRHGPGRPDQRPAPAVRRRPRARPAVAQLRVRGELRHQPGRGRPGHHQLDRRPAVPDRGPGPPVVGHRRPQPGRRPDPGAGRQLRPGPGLRRPGPEQHRQRRQPRQLPLCRDRRRQHLRQPDRRRHRRQRQLLVQHHQRRPGDRRGRPPRRRSSRSSPTRRRGATTPTP